MPVINQQTLGSYASFTAAVAGIPAGPWPPGGYELVADDVGPYNETIHINPATVSVADKGGEPLVISGTGATYNTILDAALAPAGGSGVYVYGVNDATIRRLAIRNVHPTNTATDAAVRIGEKAGGTDLPAHRIVVEQCALGQATIPSANAGVIIWGQGAPCEDCVVRGDPAAGPLQGNIILAAYSWQIYANNCTRLTVDRTVGLQFDGSLGASAIEVDNCTDVELSRLFQRQHNGRALRVANSDQVRLINSMIQDCNETGLADEYIELDTVTGFAAWNNSFGHFDGAKPISALIYAHDTPANGLLHLGGNIFYLKGTSRTILRFDAPVDLSRVVARSNNYYRPDAAQPTGTPTTATVDAPAASYTTLGDWQAISGQDPGGLFGTERSIEADPMFDSVLPGPGGSMLLTTGSAAIDIAPASWTAAFVAGTVVTPIVDDLLDNARPINVRNDAGAHETTALASTAIVSPSTVEKDGGYRISVVGLSVPDGLYRFRLGPTGTTADPLCYAGAYGSENDVTVTLGSGLFVSPPLPSGGAYSIYLQGVAPGVTSGMAETVPGSISYVHKNHRSSLYSLRSLLLPWWNTGPRRVDKEPLQS